MKRLTHVASATLFVAVLMMCGLAYSASVATLYDSAKRVIAAGNVVPERDFAPLISVLRARGSTDDSPERAVSSITRAPEGARLVPVKIDRLCHDGSRHQNQDWDSRG